MVRTLTSEVETPPIGPDHPDWDPDAKLEAGARGRRRGSTARSGTWRSTARPTSPKAMVDTGDPHDGPPALPGELHRCG